MSTTNQGVEELVGWQISELCQLVRQGRTDKEGPDQKMNHNYRHSDSQVVE